jgi:hypothetical protein
MKTKPFTILSLAAVLLLAAPIPAWAYLDPGSVSLVVQGAVAAVATAAATFRLWWYRVKELVWRKPSASIDQLGDRKIDRSGNTDGKP